jgi:hypothetical protein
LRRSVVLFESNSFRHRALSRKASRADGAFYPSLYPSFGLIRCETRWHGVASPHGAPQPELRRLEAAQGSRRRFTPDLQRDHGGRGLAQAHAIRGQMGRIFAPIGQSWRRNWSRLTPFFDYPSDIRKVIYTTNAIESVNMSLRKITKTRGSFPTDEAVFKLFYLAPNNISQKWTMPIRDWKAALNRFTIQFDERMPRL